MDQENREINEWVEESGLVQIHEDEIPPEHKLPLKPLIAIACVLVLAMLVVAFLAYDRMFGENKQVIPADAYFSASEGKVSILYNTTMSSYFGIMAGESIYLPLEFLQEVDDFYYYDEVAQLLLYAKPMELLSYAVHSVGDISEVDAQGEAFRYQGCVYVSMSVFQDISYVLCETLFEPDRVWVWDEFNQELASAMTKGKTKIRQSGNKRAAVVQVLEEAQTLYVLEEGKRFTRVMSEQGFIGFVENDTIQTAEPVIHKTQKVPYEYTSLHMEEPITLVWHQLFSGSVSNQTERFVNAMEQTKGVNVVSPTWFSIVSADGTITSVGDPTYTEAAHARGLQVWALIDNFNKDVDNAALLRGYPYRAKLISQLMEEAKRLQIDGINIDFEANSSGMGGLNRDSGVHFIQFLRELSIECRKAGLVLSVDNYVPMSYNQYYYRQKQAQVVDYIIIMGYDEHYGGGTPGSTASFPFVKSGIENTLEQVPKEKVINAVPFYTRLWKMTPAELAEENAKIIQEEDSPIGPYALSSTAYGAKAMAELLEGKDAQMHWLETEQQYYVEYESEQCYYRLWVEDVSSMKQRMEMVASFDLAGVACWKLGLESPEMWDILYEAMHKEAE